MVHVEVVQCTSMVHVEVVHVEVVQVHMEVVHLAVLCIVYLWQWGYEGYCVLCTYGSGAMRGTVYCVPVAVGAMRGNL